VGFFGKLLLIKPALQANTPMMNWLVVITMINAAISAGYYLRIVAAMFLRSDPSEEQVFAPSEPVSLAAPALAVRAPMPILVAITLSVAGTLIYGMVLPATQVLTSRASSAANTDNGVFLPYNGFEEDEPATTEPEVTQAPTAATVVASER
jgi:NADH-quinone oxidoreductase subunit N